MADNNGKLWKVVLGIIGAMGLALLTFTSYIVANDVSSRTRDTENSGKVAVVDKATATNTESIKYIGEEIKEFKTEQRSFNGRIDLKLDRILAK